MEKTGPLGEDLEATAAILAAAEGQPDGWLSAEDARSALNADHLTGPERWTDQLHELTATSPSVHIVAACSDHYPHNLRTVPGRPAILFIDGQLTTGDRRAIAIVGSRTAPLDALDMAHSIAYALAARDFTVVSGLARGIDTAAHEGALAASGRTLAVMGTGIGAVFPPENEVLAERIRRNGALISQFPPGYGPTKTTFPARNAVIAGMSLGSLVIAANELSGTRIEINDTLAQGRPVFLWATSLRSEPWARQLALDPLVRFVDSVGEITDALSPNITT